MWYNNQTNGYVALISILVIGAVATSITAFLLLSGINASKSAVVIDQGYQAQVLTSACMEEALQQIRDLTSFAGSGNLSLGNGSCTYNVVNTGGSNRTVSATGTVGTILRKATASVTAITPLITISSWQETN